MGSTTSTQAAPTLRRRIAASPAARLAALPMRVWLIGQHNWRTFVASVKWLVRSREHTNFTYDLTPLNLEHLAWFISEITGESRTNVLGYFDELLGDDDLAAVILDRQRASRRGGLIDRQVRFGRRVGWYALVRSLKPAHVVETGTDKGLGSVVLASALLRNGSGRLTTIDISEAAGPLICAPYDSVIDRRTGDSLAELASLEPAELFIHDSDHRPEHERNELETVRLTGLALALSDNAHVSDVLPKWAQTHGRRFLYFHERPAGHWYPGGGIGIAWIAEPPDAST